MPEGYPKGYDHATQSESKVPSNPQAPMPTASKSPVINKPTEKRNQQSGPAGWKNK